MKNWKSTFAFVIFVAVYVYSVIQPSSDGVVETAGYIALIASIFMMMRSQITSDMLTELIKLIGAKK